MKVLVVHNILWAHYKSLIFQELFKQTQSSPDISIKVVQIARNERSRASFEAAADPNAPVYTYPYTLLYDQFIEDLSVRDRFRGLLAQTRQFKPDVIYLTGYYDPAQILLLFYARWQNIRVVIQNESTAADHQRGGWKEWVKRRITRLSDGFFCFGSRSADYLIQLGVPPNKILLRKNAVDNHVLLKTYQESLPSRTQRQQQLGLPANNFIFVGRLIDVKNLETLIEAFALANQQVQATTDSALSRWGLILFGEGPLQEKLSQRIQALGLQHLVRFLPGQPWYRVPESLSLADVLVLPSWSETWGLVVNEAMVCGMPVIVSERCGCAIDLVQHGRNGFVINPYKPEELANYMTMFMNNDVNRAQMGQAARQLIEPYAPEAVAREMLQGFVKLNGS
ncbi:hypothetical protein GCM10023189_41500 [Nibrella saemangeumensis]|uniref:Uncharacterized protein n=1 Tax=Nibrella saemangeumensis TaxID=1084526 RepID=A0ABP8NCT9_9BACT